jgi:hypothetical protein
VINPIHVVLLVAILAIWLGSAILADRVADRKERVGGVYLFGALLLGPVVLLIALIIPHRRV